MSVTLESGQDILCLETSGRRLKKFQLEKKVKINFFLAAPVSFLLFTPLYLQIYESFWKKKLHTWIDLQEAP